MKNKILFVIILIILTASAASGYDAAQLNTALDNIYKSELDSATTLSISDFQLTHNSLELNFIEGRLTFFKPLVLDSEKIYYGAYFNGTGRIAFQPPTNMEQEQLKRFVGKDSLSGKFAEVYLLFNQEIYQKIVDAQFPPAVKFVKSDTYNSNRLKKILSEDYHESYFFMTLKSLINPTPNPFLLVNVDVQHIDRMFYYYNPFAREEIKLYKKYVTLGYNFMELINSFSQYNTDENYINLNGRSKEQLKVNHYDIDASIDRKGKYSGITKVTFEVTASPLQLAEFQLDPELHINSITDSLGKEIMFNRNILKTTFEELDAYDINIIFNRPLSFGETITLNFQYEGEIAEHDLGELYVHAGSHWYPRYGFRQLATFNMNFKTDNDNAFIATGVKTNEKTIKDTLFTSWLVSTPSANISFNIGYMKKYIFESEDVVPVEIYYSKELHNEMAQSLSKDLVAIGSKMEEQIAEDVINSIRVFQHYFGPYPYEKLIAGEILVNHAEAFPGFLHLGFDTWINTDFWGNDKILRSHEVAHQWWGVQVGYETYHDKWLSEGFATYSSLMYYQAVTDNDKFLDKLKEYRTEIFSVRKYLIGSGEESGPIALGTRTSSTKTKGDYGLIIYKKGAYVLHMLRNLLIDFKTMNEDKFMALMKVFYGKFRGKKASTADFQALAEKYAGEDLSWFFNQWVYGNELPTYEFSYSYETDSDGGLIVKCKIITKNVSDDFKMYLPLEIEIDDDRKAYIRILVDKPVYEFTLPGLSSRPKNIRLNPFESVLAKVKQ